MTSSSPLPRSRPSGSRSAAALVASLALAAGLAACGTDDTASDPASSASPPEATSESTSESPSESPTESPEAPEPGSDGQDTIPVTGSAGVTEATLLSATEGGGSESTLAFALDTDQARADFVAQLDGGFADTVDAAATEMTQESPGSTVYGTTVAIGCEAPLGVTIDAGEAGFEVTAELPESTVQCLAPVTYVVLFAVPDA